MSVWRRLLPRTIAGRTVLILVVGLSLSHAFSVVFHQHDRDMLLVATGGNEFAHRVATAASVLHVVPPDWREKIAAASQAEDLRLALVEEPIEALAGVPDWRAEHVRSLILTGLPEGVSGEGVRVSVHDGTDPARWLAAVPLGDGEWLLADGALRPLDGPSALSMDMIASTLVMFIAVLAGSVWAARHLTRPLRDLSEAADRLGRDVAAPPLAEGGPEEVRRAAEAFNRMQARLRRYVEDRLQMLAAISHDLRTPITLLRLRAEFMENEQDKRRMLETLDEMGEMVEGVLAFAREEAAEEPARAVDLGALTESLCADLADAGMPVECGPLPAVTVTCRPGALRRALSNLIGNAVRHGGRAVVSLEAGAGNVQVHVDDAGPGIPEAELEQVFRPFYRVERSRNRETGGVGLGLAVVRTVAHAHGGEAILVNRAEGGLRATLRLPAA